MCACAGHPRGRVFHITSHWQSAALCFACTSRHSTVAHMSTTTAGSGKTTLVGCIGGRTSNALTTEGDILFNGEPLSRKIKRDIGFVLQDDLLFDSLTVHETLLYAARLRLPRDIPLCAPPAAHVHFEAKAHTLQGAKHSLHMCISCAAAHNALGAASMRLLSVNSVAGGHARCCCACGSLLAWHACACLTHMLQYET